MANFMYLFRHNQTALRSMSPEQMQQLTKKWMGWAETLKKNGHFKQAGERLDGTGKVVRGKSKIVTDGPFVEAKEVIGGYAIFELRDKDEALASAREFMQLHKDLMPGWEGTCEVRAFAGFAGG